MTFLLTRILRAALDYKDAHGDSRCDSYKEGDSDRNRHGDINSGATPTAMRTPCDRNRDGHLRNLRTH